MEGREPSGMSRKWSGLVRGLWRMRRETLRQGRELRPVANGQRGAASDKAERGHQRDGAWDANGELGGRRGGVQAQDLA